MKKFNSQIEYKKYYQKQKLVIIFIRLTIIFTCLFTWDYLAKKGIINTFIYSSPKRICQTIYNLILENNLFTHIFTTIYEVIIAFLLGNILAFIIAIIFYQLPIIAKIFDPFLTVLNSLPKVALGPIIIIIAGANTKSIIIMALLINLIVSIITIYNGFLNVDKTKLKMFKVFNASKKDTLFKLVIPTSYTAIVSSFKLSIALTLIGVLTGEFLVSKKGIGYLIIYGTQVFNLDLVLAGIIILIIISYIFYNIVIIIEKSKKK